MGVVEAARELEVVNAIVDGEAVVTNEAGLPDFAALKPSRGIPTHSFLWASCAAHRVS